MIRQCLIVGTLCSLLAVAQPAFGHGLLMKLRGDGDQLVGELYYSNGNRAGGEWIEVTDLQKTTVPRRLQTGPDGRFTATGQPGHRYNVKAMGEEGHEIEMEIELEGSSRGQMIEHPEEEEKAAQEKSPYPAWALIGGGLLLSVIPALWLRRKDSKG